MRDKSKYRLIKLMLAFLVGIFMIYNSSTYAKADTIMNEGVYQIGDNVYATFEGDTATIYGEGSTWDYCNDGYDITGNHFNPFSKNYPKNVRVEEGITGLGDYIFYNKYYKNGYYSIKLPNSLIRIGKYAFLECSNLMEIDIPEGVKELEDSLFDECRNLTRISFSESITKIGNGTFNLCESLEDITIPNSVKEIGYQAFGGCSKLQKIIIPEGITKINRSTFFGCFNLKEIELPKSIKSIGNQAFAYCYNLENIQLPDAIEVIDYNAFWNCTSLRSIVLPPRLTRLESATFAGCSKLNKVVLPENVEYIGEECFTACIRLTNIYIPKSVNNIYWNAFLYCDNTTINAPKGSYSEIYAINNNMEYSEICTIKNVEGVPTLFSSHNIKTDLSFNPTCTETGLTEGSHCEICNEVIKKQEIIPSKGHNWDEGIIETEETCKEEGIKTYKCKDCNEVKREKLESLGHDYSEEWTIDKEATCTTEGSKSHHCTRCNEKTEIATIEALGHTTIIDKGVAPTCTEAGLTEGSHCEICNEVIKKQEIIPSKGHNWDEGIIEKEATCTEEGIETYKCKDCNEVKRENLESLGHDYNEEWTIDKEVTCTTEGSKSHHCTRCNGKTDITTIEALGHTTIIDKGVAPTCTEAGLTEGSHCEVCNEVIKKQEIILAKGHNWNEGIIETEETCKEEGIKTYKCKDCNEVKREKLESLGHNYSEEWTIDKEATSTTVGIKSRHCTRCDEKTDITYIEMIKFGWIYENTKWYYYNQNGKMETGWLNDNGTWYYLNNSGVMETGWLNDNGTWYYLNNSGAMVTGWLNDNGIWYYLNNSGAMLTGWLNDNGTWYYLNNSGAMLTGWLNDNGTWYYLNNNGAMVTGWNYINNEWYYMYSSGSMAINCIIDGWKIDANGVAKI